MAVTVVRSEIAFGATQQIPGLDVLIDPPPGFMPATAFMGYQNVQAFSTLEIEELDASFQQLAEQLTTEEFAQKGVNLLEKQFLNIGDRKALLLRLELGPQRPAFDKWMLVVGDAFRSLSVTASYPRLAAPELSDVLKQSVLSVQWLRTPEQQLFFDLPFITIETADLKFAKRTPNMLVMADISATGSLTSDSPSIVIGHLKSETELVDIESISHQQLARLSNLEIIDVTSEGETRVAGIRAYQISAKARLKDTAKSVSFHQILVFQPYKYLVIHSSVEESLAGRYVPQFEQVIKSIAFKKAN